MKKILLILLIFACFSGYAQRATTQQILQGEGGTGTVTAVSSANTDLMTVANSTTTPAITVVTGNVADGGTGLSTQNQIYDYVATSIVNFITKAQTTDSLNTRLAYYLLKTQIGDSILARITGKVNYSDSTDLVYITYYKLDSILNTLPGGHDAVTLAGTATYLGLVGQQITQNALDTGDVNINKAKWRPFIAANAEGGTPQKLSDIAMNSATTADQTFKVNENTSFKLTNNEDEEMFSVIEANKMATFQGYLYAYGGLSVNSTPNTFSFPATKGTSGQGIVSDGAGASSWGNLAPVNATYYVRQGTSGLTNEYSLGDLGNGLLYNTTSAGVSTITIATTEQLPYVALTGNQTVAGIKTFTNGGIFGTTTGTSILGGDIQYGAGTDLSIGNYNGGGGIKFKVSPTFGSAGYVIYQTIAANKNLFNLPIELDSTLIDINGDKGSVGQILSKAHNGVDWITYSANITGGTLGAIPYQTGVNTTGVLSATATANKLLVSGANAAPTWSTPTFPNASATNRKIIVSDGTNWVASTETYAVPGTSGNYMKSDGTNWTSAAFPTVGDITKVGTPVDNQLGIWTGSGTLEGDVDLTFDGIHLQVNSTSTASNLCVGSDGIETTGDMRVYNGALSARYGTPSAVGTWLDIRANDGYISLNMWDGVNSSGEYMRFNEVTEKVTMYKPLVAIAATTSLAPVNIPHGTAPTSPTNGDLWTTTVAPFVRINGTTHNLLIGTSSSGQFLINNSGVMAGSAGMYYNATNATLQIEGANYNSGNLTGSFESGTFGDHFDSNGYDRTLYVGYNSAGYANDALHYNTEIAASSVGSGVTKAWTTGKAGGTSTGAAVTIAIPESVIMSGQINLLAYNSTDGKYTQCVYNVYSNNGAAFSPTVSLIDRIGDAEENTVALSLVGSGTTLTISATNLTTADAYKVTYHFTGTFVEY